MANLYEFEWAKSVRHIFYNIAFEIPKGVRPPQWIKQAFANSVTIRQS